MSANLLQLSVDGNCRSADLSAQIWTHISRELYLFDRTALDMLGGGFDKLVLRGEG
jgi:hypothetical protein